MVKSIREKVSGGLVFSGLASMTISIFLLCNTSKNIYNHVAKGNYSIKQEKLQKDMINYGSLGVGGSILLMGGLMLNGRKKNEEYKI